MKKYTLSLVALALSSSLYGASKGAEFGFTSMRQLAMGGTGVAITYDEHALYRNPAALGKAKFDINLPAIRVGVDQEGIDRSNDLKDLLSDDLSDDEARNKILKFVPSDMSISAGTTPFSLTSQGFGMAVFGQADAMVRFRDRVTPKVYADVNVDAAAYVGASMRGLPLLGHRALYGASVGYAQRRYGNEVFETADFSEDGELDMDLKTVSGLTYNAGLLIPFHIKSQEIYFGAVFNNIGTTLEGDSDDDGEDVEVPFTSTIGIGMDAKLPLIGKTTLAADYKVVSEQDNAILNLHLGAEKKLLKNFITLRGGLNQGYVVGGITLNFFLFKLGYVVHTRELGDYPGENKQTQHVLECSLGF
jgi:hypothetical protein